jgi:hypothetical protein
LYLRQVAMQVEGKTRTLVGFSDSLGYRAGTVAAGHVSDSEGDHRFPFQNGSEATVNLDIMGMSRVFLSSQSPGSVALTFPQGQA